MALSSQDVRTLALLTLRATDTKLITIAMGSLGITSRVFFPAIGSRMTYAFIGGESAPGQLAFSETFYLLRRFYPTFNDEKIAELQDLEDV